MTEREAFRTLQLDPAACPEVVEAAYAVLREMVLRSDADDAPRRLAQLGTAHRLLGDLGRGVDRAPVERRR